MGQITILYEHSIKRQNDNYKFQAAIHGIDLDKENKGNNKSRSNSSNMLEFKDPSEYEHLSKEEKDELTKKMMGGHMRAVQSSGFGK